MKTKWTEEHLIQQPKQFEKLNHDVYIQRRNIKMEQTEEDPSEIGWVCESRFISKDIYEDFMDVLNSPAQEQIVNNFVTIQNAQAGTDENTITLMMGTADVYEKIDELIEMLGSILGRG